MITLDLAGAAALLGIHPDTCRERAAAGVIPGAKIGRAWVFVEVDLIEYIRSQYRGGGVDYRPTAATKFKGSTYANAAEELDARLARPTAEQRKRAKTAA